MKNDILYILDEDNAKIPKESKVVFLKKDSEEFKNRIKVVQEFTEYQDCFRCKLLSFNKKVFEKLRPLIEQDEEYKYLTSSLFFEKSPYKTSYVYNFYKLYIVANYIKKNKIKKLYLKSEQNIIIDFFTRFSETNGLTIVSQSRKKKKKNIKNLVLSNFYLSALFIFGREIKKIFKAAKKNKKTHDKLAVSYFPNYYFEEKEFISNYYGDVSKKINKEYDWLFIYVQDLKKLEKEIGVLNYNNFESFNFIDSFFSIKDIAYSLKKSYRVHKKLKKIQTSNLFIFDSVNYLDILTDDWKKTLSSVLIDTIVFEKKFENFLENNKYSEIIYLMEYQPWEDMLNKVARKKNIRLKGVTHSVIRPNLMNYHHETVLHEHINTPDLVGSNSIISDKIFRKNGFDEHQVRPIEAQRFIYLSDKIKDNPDCLNKLLITTSIDFDETEELLISFSKAYKKDTFKKIFIKPHPYLDVEKIIKNIDDFPEYTILSGNMNEAFKKVDTVLTANSSSVLLESILNNKITITLFSLRSLPMPAINEHQFLNVATSIESLKNILRKKNDRNIKPDFKNFLYLNNDFKMWAEFLDLAEFNDD
jgi:surface carbohydrate biosynthesis protein (TIGR04326 family)